MLGVSTEPWRREVGIMESLHRKRLVCPFLRHPQFRRVFPFRMDKESQRRRSVRHQAGKASAQPVGVIRGQHRLLGVIIQVPVHKRPVSHLHEIERRVFIPQPFPSCISYHAPHRARKRRTKRVQPVPYLLTRYSQFKVEGGYSMVAIQIALAAVSMLPSRTQCYYLGYYPQIDCGVCCG